MSSKSEQAVTLLYDAKANLEQCIEQLAHYVRLTDDQRTELYLIRNLRIFVDHNHGILAREHTIQDLIDQYFEDESDLEHEYDFA